jgi:hypothetical protein
MMPPPLPVPFRCPRRIGFLFPHPCDRITPIDCPHCNGGLIDDPYMSHDRSFYSSWDDYSDYGSGYAAAESSSSDVISSSDMEFNESDGADMVSTGGDDFEDDMSGS